MLADGRVVVEMCAGWVAKIPGVTTWGAQEGWRVVVRAGGLTTWTSAQVRAEGLSPRVAARHGAYLVLSADNLRALRAAVHEWGAQGHLNPEHTDDAEGWTPVTLARPERPNRWQTVRCPFHPDRHPSAGVRWNSDGTTGGFHCFVCQRTDGRAATGVARRAPQGIEVLRVDAPAPAVTPRARLDSVDRTSTSTFNTPVGPVGVSPGPVIGLPLPSSATDRASAWSVRLRADQFPTDDPRHQRWSAHGAPIANLYVRMLRADGRARGAGRQRAIEEAGAAFERAAGAARGAPPDPRGFWADDLYTIDDTRVTEWEERRKAGSWHRDATGRQAYTPGRTYWTPKAFAAESRPRALWDLDHVGGLTRCVRRKVAGEIARVIALHPDLTGAHVALVTSWTGLQVLADLSSPVAPGWFNTPQGMRWYLAIGTALLAAVRGAGATGGEIDLTATDPGRLGRLAGVRLTKAGLPFTTEILSLALPAGVALTARDARLLDALTSPAGRPGPGPVPEYAAP